MAKFKILLFGIVKDIAGSPMLECETPDNTTVGELLANLKKDYPALEGLRSLAVAVNSSYAEHGDLLMEGDEIALIPPVAGG